MVKRRLLTLAFMLYLTISAMGQQIPDGYNPFVPANLDDPAKLQVSPVVESSYHKYWVEGDMNYGDPSTFAWYVENGTLGTYDTITDVWTPMPRVLTIGLGTGAVFKGTNVNGVDNSSEVWVRWNDNSAGSTGYIAVYEKSNDGCIISDQISGYKHTIVAPPEIWFTASNFEQCADQIYSVTVKFNNVFIYSYPYTFSYTYPGNDGKTVTGEMVIGVGDLDASLQYTFELLAVQDLDVTRDEKYDIILEKLTDKFGSNGKIAPLGIPGGQYTTVDLTIYHLPQTGRMTMD